MNGVLEKMKLWDFVCTNEKCYFVEEFLVPSQDENSPIECPECGEDMLKSLGGKLTLFDMSQHQNFLQQRSKRHGAEILRGERSPHENESGVCSDPVWRNKTRTKNTSSNTIEQHKYDYLK